MHTKDAGARQESSVRLNLVAAWGEAKVFTDAERAALELTERAPASPMPPVVSPTRLGECRKNYDEGPARRPWCPSFAIMNTWNRLNVNHPAARGDYQPASG